MAGWRTTRLCCHSDFLCAHTNRSKPTKSRDGLLGLEQIIWTWFGTNNLNLCCFLFFLNLAPLEGRKYNLMYRKGTWLRRSLPSPNSDCTFLKVLNEGGLKENLRNVEENGLNQGQFCCQRNISYKKQNLVTIPSYGHGGWPEKKPSWADTPVTQRL